MSGKRTRRRSQSDSFAPALAPLTLAALAIAATACGAARSPEATLVTEPAAPQTAGTESTSSSASAGSESSPSATSAGTEGSPSTTTAGAENSASAESGADGSRSMTPGAAATDACRAERTAILAAMADSRARSTCASPADCAVVTGPGHPDPEYAEVVAAVDAAALDARAQAHLATCGAFHHHEAIAAFRVVEAACTGGHCVADETTFHVEE